MREITVKIILKPENGKFGETEMFMKGQQGWSAAERSMFMMTLIGLGDQVLADKIK
jgi:hypothetical protein